MSECVIKKKCRHSFTFSKQHDTNKVMCVRSNVCVWWFFVLRWELHVWQRKAFKVLYIYVCVCVGARNSKCIQEKEVIKEKKFVWTCILLHHTLTIIVGVVLWQEMFQLFVGRLFIDFFNYVSLFCQLKGVLQSSTTFMHILFDMSIF